jgi:hypothetical protein
MDLSTLIPVIGQLLTLGFKLAAIVDKAENLTADDKLALKEAIKNAQQGVTYWTDEQVAPGTDGEGGPVSEDNPVPDNG